MTEHKINVNLNDMESFNIAEKYLYQMEASVRKAIANALDEIGEIMLDTVRAELSSMGLGDSSFMNEVYVRRYGTGISLKVTSDHLLFVEFGTGIVGDNDQHPDKYFMEQNWSYDTNERGEKGWWYPTTADDPNPHKQTGSDGTLYAFTKGQKSRPFMYHTWLYVNAIGEGIMQKHLGRV